MLQEWIKRTQANQPIHTIRELYELWLNCCNDVYHKTMQTQHCQEAYGEFVNAAFNFWKTAMPK